MLHSCIVDHLIHSVWRGPRLVATEVEEYMSCPHGLSSDPRTCSQCIGFVGVKRITLKNGEARINGRKSGAVELHGKELLKAYNTAAFRNSKGARARKQAAKTAVPATDDDLILDEGW